MKRLLINKCLDFKVQMTFLQQSAGKHREDKWMADKIKSNFST